MLIVLIKVILISIMLFGNFLSIIMVHTLPKKDKSLKWNLDARFYLYSFSNIIDFVLIIIAVHILPNEMKEPKSWIIVVIAVGFIFSFVISFLSDSYAIKKRFDPYTKKYIDEYNRYMEKEKKFASWNTIEYAAFSSVLITIFLIIIADS